MRSDEEKEFTAETIEGEVLASTVEEKAPVTERQPPGLGAKNEKTVVALSEANRESAPTKTKNSEAWLQYIVVPLIFLLVTLLGGLRLSQAANELIFLKPALVCLVFAVFLIVLFFRAGLIRTGGWFSEDFSPLRNTSNAGVLITLFAASTQIFNSLLPERGLPFWVVAFFFFWSLWTNLFARFETKKLLVSLGSLFGLAFITKYVVLAGLTATGEEGSGFFQALLAGDLTRETITYLLDLPRFSRGTGYIQFFAVIFYLIGLFLLNPGAAADPGES